MSTSRRLTLVLSEAQFNALADAIAVRDAEDEGRVLDSHQRGSALARQNAWQKLRAAWYGASR